MKSKITENINIVILKYIFMALILYLLVDNDKLNIMNVTILLLYIATNQIRNFIIKKNKVYIAVTFLVEFMFSIIIFKFIANDGYLVFMPTIIDVATSFSSIFTISYFIATSSASYYLGDNEQALHLVFLSLPIVFLGEIINKESSSKVKAQELYDKLRINEEELKKVNVELENYANTIEEISVLRERNRISREIHDNVGHALSTINIQLGAIEKIAIKDGELASEMANNLAEFTKGSLESVRTAVRKMKPREFEEFEGIVAISEMIKNFEKLSAIKVKLRISENIWKINSDQTMVVYRLVQEFLSNSIRHGSASEVKIFINFLEDSLRLQLKDNGKGCNNVIEGVGINSIRERVQVWGGSVEYYSKENEGFELIVAMDRGKLSIDEK